MFIAVVRFSNGEEEILYKGTDSNRCVDKAKYAAEYYRDYGGVVEVQHK